MNGRFRNGFFEMDDGAPNRKEEQHLFLLHICAVFFVCVSVLLLVYAFFLYAHICLIVFLAGTTWPSVDDERWRRHFFFFFLLFRFFLYACVCCLTLFTAGDVYVRMYKINIAEWIPKENEPNYDDFFLLLLLLVRLLMFNTEETCLFFFFSLNRRKELLNLREYRQ